MSRQTLFEDSFQQVRATLSEEHSPCVLGGQRRPRTAHRRGESPAQPATRSARARTAVAVTPFSAAQQQPSETARRRSGEGAGLADSFCVNETAERKRNGFRNKHILTLTFLRLY